MQLDTATPSRLPKLVAAVILGALALYAAAMFLGTGEAAVFVGLLHEKFEAPLLVGVLGALVSSAVGHALLRCLQIKEADPTELRLCALPVGACLLSLATLCLGAMGSLHPSVFVVLAAAIAVFHVAHNRDSMIRLAGDSLPAWTVAAVSVTALCAALYLLCAFLPPWEYDVTEYHLGAPADYFRAGHVCFLKDNVYSNFPSNAEMTYLAGMVLTGGKLAGAYASKVVNVIYGLVIAGLIALSCRTVFRGRWRWEAFLAVYASPVILASGMVAYVTMPLLLYTTLAVYALLRALRENDEANQRRWLVLCGIGVGAAMGTKYTGFLLVLVPVTAAVAAWGRMGMAARAKRLACVLVPAAVLVSPWLIRNAVNTGNPVYPLLDRVFQSGNWSHEKDARFKQAHSPEDTSLGNLVARAGQFLANRNKTYLCGALVLLALLSLAAWRKPENWPLIALLAGLWLAMLLLWYFFTHQIDRFLAPSIVVLGFLAAAGVSNMAHTKAGAFTMRAIVGVFVAFSMFQGLLMARNAGVFDGALMFDDNSENMQAFMTEHTDFGEVWEVLDFADKKLPAEAKIMFVGEARTFWCPRRVWASTVFDDAPLAGALAESCDYAALDRMRKNGVTHILINWAELGRLAKTYAFAFNGRMQPGYMNLTEPQWKRFQRIRQKHLKLIKTAGKQYPSGEHHVELYEVVYPPDL